MSRIGKLPIPIPEGVQFSYADDVFRVKGPKGMLEMKIPFSGSVDTHEGEIVIGPGGEDRVSRAKHGLVRSLVNNMVIGVTEGFSRTLKIVGVGYKAQVQGKTLQLNLGYSHPIKYAIPEGIAIDTPDPNTIIVSGVDKEVVGKCASEIRKFRKPEPYKGKGVMYTDEHVRRKAGKASVK
jgi:large subunit ribosomal protein L6